MRDKGAVAVSIVVPVYGVEAYLSQCLDSVASQTFVDWECVLVDDGSPDRCGEICDQYVREDPRFRVIHKQNGGVSAARNDGIAAASGRWVYIIDSDDWIEPDAIQRLYEAGEANDVDCVMSDYVIAAEGEAPVPHVLFDETHVSRGRSEVDRIQRCVLYQRRDRCFTGYVAPWSKFMRMSVLREGGVGFDTSMRGVFDDGLFSLSLFEHCDSVMYLQGVTYNYRVVPTSITRSFKANAMEIELHTYEKIEEFLRENRKGSEFWQAYCNHVVVYLGSYLSSYYFNPANPASRREMVRQLRGDLSRDPVRSAVRGAKVSELMLRGKYLAVCEHLRWVAGLHLYAWAKLRMAA